MAMNVEKIVCDAKTRLEGHIEINRCIVGMYRYNGESFEVELWNANNFREEIAPKHWTSDNMPPKRQNLSCEKFVAFLLSFDLRRLDLSDQTS